MKRTAVIIDIDGTLANNSHRVRFVDGSQKKDWEAFNKLSEFDTVNEWCRQIVYAMHDKGHKILFLTARTGSPTIRKLTEQWLFTNIGPLDSELIMREEDDYRTDFLTKNDLYNKHIMPFYDVLFAIDDKERVCNMWRNLGIAALQCEDY